MISYTWLVFCCQIIKLEMSGRTVNYLLILILCAAYCRFLVHLFIICSLDPWNTLKEESSTVLNLICLSLNCVLAYCEAQWTFGDRAHCSVFSFPLWIRCNLSLFCTLFLVFSLLNDKIHLQNTLVIWDKTST